MISANCSALVRSDIDAADLDVLEVVQSTKADAVRVVVQVNSKLDLCALDLIWDLVLCKEILRDAKRKPGRVSVDIGVWTPYASARKLQRLRIGCFCSDESFAIKALRSCC